MESKNSLEFSFFEVHIQSKFAFEIRAYAMINEKLDLTALGFIQHETR